MRIHWPSLIALIPASSPEPPQEPGPLLAPMPDDPLSVGREILYGRDEAGAVFVGIDPAAPGADLSVEYTIPAKTLRRRARLKARADRGLR